jgi:hypothetical protein
MDDEDSEPQAFRSPSAPLTAEDLYAVLEAHVTAMLADANAGEYLTIEYHSPSGAVLHVTDIGYTSSDLLILSARDQTQQACQILVHKHALQLVMKFEQGGRPAERRAIGFRGDRSQSATRKSTELSESN